MWATHERNRCAHVRSRACPVDRHGGHQHGGRVRGLPAVRLRRDLAVDLGVAARRRARLRVERIGDRLSAERHRAAVAGVDLAAPRECVVLGNTQRRARPCRPDTRRACGARRRAAATDRPADADLRLLECDAYAAAVQPAVAGVRSGGVAACGAATVACRCVSRAGHAEAAGGGTCTSSG